MHKKFKPIDAVLLIGPTGSGKTPLGDYIEQKGIAGRRCLHFDFGHELRTLVGAVDLPSGFTQAEHQFIVDVLEKGQLLEDRHFPIAEKIVQNFMSCRGCSESDLVILNGLPRHEGQARDMARLVNVTGLFVLDCAAEDVRARIGQNTGGDRSRRTDDSVEMIRKKLTIFRDRTEPLIGYYSGRGSFLLRMRVDASSTTEDLYSRLISFFLA